MKERERETAVSKNQPYSKVFAKVRDRKVEKERQEGGERVGELMDF